MIDQNIEYIQNDIVKVGISPSKGATILTLQYKNEDILYHDEDNIHSFERPRCGIPVLFPSCGRCENDLIHMNNMAYPMPIHGFLHLSNLTVEKKSKGELSCSLSDSKFTRIFYPFRFKCILTYKLRSNGIVIEFSLSNMDNIAIPFIYGLHPYFFINDIKDVCIDIPGDTYTDHLTNKKFKYKDPLSLHDDDICYIFNNNGNVITLSNDYSKKNIILNADKYFKYFLLWRNKKTNFLCIEPWGDLPNAINKTTCNKLDPNEHIKISFSISIKERRC